MRITVDTPSPHDFLSVFVIEAHFRLDRWTTETVCWEFESIATSTPAAQFLADLEMTCDEAGNEVFFELPSNFSRWRRLPTAWVVDTAQDVPDGHTNAERVQWPGLEAGKPARLDGWAMFWYDENGRKFNAHVEA